MRRDMRASAGSRRRVASGGGAYAHGATDTQGTVYAVDSSFSGGAASKQGTFSFWVYYDGVTWPSSAYMLDGKNVSAQMLQLYTFGPGGFDLILRNSAASIIARRRTNSENPFTPQQWSHMVVSWDLSVTTLDVYVDGAVIGGFGVEVTTDDTVNALTNVSVAARTTGTNKFDGFFFDPFIEMGVYYDLSDSAELAKFINGGKPVDLSALGSPQLLLSNEFGSFELNNGSGGDLTETGGTFAAAASSPSD